MVLQKTELIFFSLISVLFLFEVPAQNTEVVKDALQSVKQSDRNLIKKLPTFSIYGDNYFVTGTSTNEKITSKNSDAKYQIGFKQLLTNVSLPYDVIPLFTYQQKAFWNIYEKSFPFRETNYNAGLGFAKLWFENNKVKQGLWFQFEHQSNGRDLENSRSWNFFSLRYLKPIGDKWQIFLKGRVPIGGLDDNPDILKYRGYMQVNVAYDMNNMFILEGEFRDAIFDGWRGSAQLSLSWRYSKASNQFLCLQYFGGFSEDLINYNQAVSKLRIGFVFKELFVNQKK